MNTHEPIRAKSIADLRKLGDEELIEQHDWIAVQARAIVGVDYYLSELNRRVIERQGRRMVFLTAIITVLTVINVVALIIGVLG